MSIRGQDLALVLSGLQKVAEAASKNRQAQLQQFWKYSSLKTVTIPETPKALKEITPKDLAQKTFMVADNAAVFGQVCGNIYLFIYQAIALAELVSNKHGRICPLSSCILQKRTPIFKYDVVWKSVFDIFFCNHI